VTCKNEVVTQYWRPRNDRASAEKGRSIGRTIQAPKIPKDCPVSAGQTLNPHWRTSYASYGPLVPFGCPTVHFLISRIWRKLCFTFTRFFRFFRMLGRDRQRHWPTTRPHRAGDRKALVLKLVSDACNLLPTSVATENLALLGRSQTIGASLFERFEEPVGQWVAKRLAEDDARTFAAVAPDRKGGRNSQDLWMGF
jgi:hypothetical protein